MNVVMLIGVVGKDPESGTTKNGHKYTNVSVATHKMIKEEQRTEWHNVTAWNKASEFLAKCRKGDRVFVKGEIQTTNYEKDGVKRYVTKVVADMVFTGSNDRSDSQADVKDEDGAPW